MGYCWCAFELLCSIWILRLGGLGCFTGFMSLFRFVYAFVVCLYCLFVTFNWFLLVFVSLLLGLAVS